MFAKKSRFFTVFWKLIQITTFPFRESEQSILGSIGAVKPNISRKWEWVTKMIMMTIISWSIIFSFFRATRLRSRKVLTQHIPEVGMKTVPVDNLNLEAFFTSSRISIQPMQKNIFVLSSGSSSLQAQAHAPSGSRGPPLENDKVGEKTRSCSRLPQCGFAPVGGSSFLQQLAAVRTPSYGSVPRCTSEWPCALPIFFSSKAL